MVLGRDLILILRSSSSSAAGNNSLSKLVGTGSNKHVVGLNILIRLFSSSCPIVVKYCSFSLGAMNEARRCRFYICYCISDAIYFTACLFTLSANSYRFYIYTMLK